MMKVQGCQVKVLVLVVVSLLAAEPLWGHTHPCGCKHKHLTGKPHEVYPWAYVLCDPPNNQKCTYKNQTGECENVQINVGLTVTTACKCEGVDPGKGGQLMCMAPGQVDIPSVTAFTIMNGLPENWARIFFTTQQEPFCGSEMDLPEAVGTFTISLDYNPTDPTMAEWLLVDLDMTVPPFVFCGMMTGLNHVSMHPEIFSSGELDLTTGIFNGFFALIMYNDIYVTTPVIEFMEVGGEIDLAGGSMTLGYLGDMMLPLCEGGAPMAGDISGPDGVPDCFVNLYDFTVLAENWLLSNPL